MQHAHRSHRLQAVVHRDDLRLFTVIAAYFPSLDITAITDATLMPPRWLVTAGTAVTAVTGHPADHPAAPATATVIDLTGSRRDLTACFREGQRAGLRLRCVARYTR